MANEHNNEVVAISYNVSEQKSASEIIANTAYYKATSGSEARLFFKTAQDTLDGKLTLNKAMLTLMFYEKDHFRIPDGKTKPVGFSRFMEENFKGYSSKQSAYNDLTVAFLIKFGTLESCLSDIRGLDNLGYSQLLEIGYAIPRKKNAKGEYTENIGEYQMRVHDIIEVVSQEVGTNRLNSSTTRKELAELLESTKRENNPQAKAKADKAAAKVAEEAAKAEKIRADEERAKTDKEFAAKLTKEHEARKTAQDEFIAAARKAHETYTQAELIALVKAFVKDEEEKG